MFKGEKEKPLVFKNNSPDHFLRDERPKRMLRGPLFHMQMKQQGCVKNTNSLRNVNRERKCGRCC